MRGRVVMVVRLNIRSVHCLRTGYDIQVRAESDEGMSDWSDQ